MQNSKKQNPIPIDSRRRVSAGGEETSAEVMWRRYVEEPIVRFRELLKVTQVGRSKAYELMNPKHRNFDPDFPSGFPLFDSPRSPKAWYREDAIAWVEGRANKQRQFQKGKVA